MSTDKNDPAISSAEDLTKTTNKSDIELKEEELEQVSGGFLKITLTDALVSSYQTSSHSGTGT